MSKIILAILTVAAFMYACWLVFFRKPLPDPRQASGFRRRFRLATLLFVGLLLGNSAGCWTCYDISVEMAQRMELDRHKKVRTALSAVWRTLDPKQSDDFRKKLEGAVKEGAIDTKASDVLAVAYEELSYHRQRTRTDIPQPTCYDMTTLGGRLADSREKVLKQLELLAKARRSGTIDEQTAFKAEMALGPELEMLFRARALSTGPGPDAESQLVQFYDEGKVVPQYSTRKAAAVIVEMERKR
jgi:hypothetical protein